VPPQIDRSKPAHKQADPTLYAGVVKERDDGIVLSGAQQLATAGLYSDYIYLSCIHPLQPGDESYANGVMIPANASGVKLYPRRPFAEVASNTFDYPLSARFDESDCFVVLDNVFVPWEHVFVYRNIDICRDQWWKTPSHLYGNHQAQTRYATKLRFMIGLAKRMNELTGLDGNPAVQIQMGELAALVSIVENMLLSHETTATIDANGILWPSKMALYSVMALQSELNSRMIEIIRELTGAGMITLPSSHRDFDNPDMRADIDRFMRSSTSDAESRVAVMRMAWDFIGSEFGNRHQQYEKFYGGASFLVKQNVYRNFDFASAKKMVDAADLGKFPVPVWHQKDGGPYIGSGSIVVMRDPDSSWINASIYRVQVHGKNRVTVQFDHPGRHGAIIAKKYWDRGQPCPVAVVNGEDPALFIAGFESLPSGFSEFDFAGAIKEGPVELYPGPRTGLPIPIHAEIVLEGVFHPATGETLMEGPFGEFTGYYASERRPLPMMEVQAIPAFLYLPPCWTA
jgi:3-octaprenyl-4-hydroxybenzoate carboxy-lyase/4-hydroxyphenylacetate 3-hydroxylase C terminal/4-hydroxyphenylacetate 3-hydroxylase N terminal